VDAPTDEHLLQAFLAGDQGGFEQLVRRYSAELHQFAYRFTGSSASAEDVVQETYLQVFTSAATFDPQRRFKPWLFTIAANKARDHLRSRTRKREVPADAPVGGQDEAGQRFSDLLDAEGPPPEAELEADDQRTTVRGILAEMPERLAEVLILGYYHHLPYRDIADIVGIPVGTVKSRLHAAVACFGERYRDATQATAKRRSAANETQPKMPS